MIPIVIKEYIKTMRHGNALDPLYFPSKITNVFLPFSLSASKSGKEAIYKTIEDNVPIIIPRNTMGKSSKPTCT
jgi:hypothetical protein